MYAHIFKGAPIGNDNAAKNHKKFKKGNKNPMSRGTKSITGKDYIANLVKFGWKVGRVTGSHHMMEREGFLSFPVPLHNKDLGIGLLKKLNKLSQRRA